MREAEQNILSGLKWPVSSRTRGRTNPGLRSLPPVGATSYVRLVCAATDREGHAYYAFDTPEEIEAMRKRFATEENPSPKYDAATRGEMTNSLGLSGEEVRRRIDRGDAHVVRLKANPGGRITLHDLIRGRVSFSTGGIDDQILIKSDGMPTYHLANVVDDREMRITHVIRGEEWLPSAPSTCCCTRPSGGNRRNGAYAAHHDPGGKGNCPSGMPKRRACP